MRIYIYNTPDKQGFPLVTTGLEIKVPKLRSKSQRL